MVQSYFSHVPEGRGKSKFEKVKVMSKLDTELVNLKKVIIQIHQKKNKSYFVTN